MSFEFGGCSFFSFIIIFTFLKVINVIYLLYLFFFSAAYNIDLNNIIFNGFFSLIIKWYLFFPSKSLELNQSSPSKLALYIDGSALSNKSFSKVILSIFLCIFFICFQNKMNTVWIAYPSLKIVFFSGLTTCQCFLFVCFL